MTIVFGPTMTDQARGFGDAAAATSSPCHSPYVVLIQDMIRMAGENPGSSDGIWGGRSTSAMQAFQRRRGLAVTQLPNEPTLRALGLTEGSVGNHIAAARESAACLARQSSPSGTSGARVEGESAPSGGVAGMLGAVPWWGWVAGAAVIVGGAAFAAGMKGKKRRRG